MLEHHTNRALANLTRILRPSWPLALIASVGQPRPVAGWPAGTVGTVVEEDSASGRALVEIVNKDRLLGLLPADEFLEDLVEVPYAHLQVMERVEGEGREADAVRGRPHSRRMAASSQRTVTPHPEGWSVERPGASRASSVHSTQDAAIKAARQNLKNAGGGELAIKGRNGAVRAQDTVRPGNDPRASKG